MTQSGSVWTGSGWDHQGAGWESQPPPACACPHPLTRSWREPTWLTTAHWKGGLWGILKQPKTIQLTYSGSVMDKRWLYIIFVNFNQQCSFYCRRSNSICKSPGPNSPKETLFTTRDIGRSESLRSSSSCSHRIFRPCDLIHGEIIGKGFFGQAIKVSLQLCLITFRTFGVPCAIGLN